MLKILLTLLMLAGITACSYRINPKEVQITPDQIQEYQVLLQQGWNIQVYEGKLILTKDYKGKVEIRDPFNTLK